MKNVQDTSIAIYHDLRGSGVINTLQQVVFDRLRLSGPLTQAEMWKFYFPHYQRYTIAPRFSELKKLGLIKDVLRRECAVTRRSCISWEVVNHDSKCDSAGVVDSNQLPANTGADQAGVSGSVPVYDIH